VGPTRFKRIQTNSNIFKYDSNDFNSVQISFDPNRNFPSSKNLKQNMVVKVLMKVTTLSIGTSLDANLELKFWESKV
jgi:hypothetical protein